MPGHLLEGETLLAGQSIPSPNGKFVTYMSTEGHVTLYRFEAGRDPVNMWRFYCYHQRPFGAVWMGVRSGYLMGGDHRYSDRPETAWWSRPTNPNGRASNPILVLQDDGNMVLYSRDAQGNILPHANGWGTGTNGSYPAAIPQSGPCAVVTAGTLAVNANTIVVNTTPSAIAVSDGQTAVVLDPQGTVGIYAPAGPGTVLLDVHSFNYDLDRGSANAGPRPQIRSERDGSTVRLVPGNPTPFEWHRTNHRTFSNLQLPWETQELADRECAQDNKPGAAPDRGHE